ncbi:ABC-1 domain-containing protein [Desulfobulbus propionicus DSM 2032]|uniref:ABC-1 domain-containing protein n=1 Tax=Desulfobulbus propionicus (strain ATCC 33891 / DSM 2032 / VKM B-1956 / 1pr3) TaxID=577650 RepID=A0A7U3YNL8_DESPD|nr:AarF/ABC1/UbiB kinase family protein [Desulfobulbus propionicus]ADW18690.1 ABC-1 domain-containing protein [Desulfobulbus propionicus DSM 2032]
MFSIRKLGAIGRTYRHLNRYHRILRVLFKYGFNDLVDRLHIDQYLESGLQMINRKPREQIARLSRPERLRLVFEELGPTFIKLGQLLSTRPDLIPADFLDELAKLQDDIAAFGIDEVQAIIKEELGRAPEEIFHYFDTEPLAAASIGQVHRARMDNGAEVVVKVQRPGIENVIAVDLEILAHIAELMEQYLEEVQGHQPMAIVHEFARSLSREIDFSIELANIQRFARQFEGNPAIHVPLVYPELSTDRILVMEYVIGIKSSKVHLLREQGYDLPLIAERGANLVMEQIFVHGFFHADPHPGNVFVLPDNVLCFIDFGQMGRLSLKDREDFTDLVLDLVAGNEQQVVSGVLKVTVQLGEVDRENLGRDLGSLMDMYLYRPLEDLEAAKILQDLLDLVSRHKLSFKPSLYLMMKALSTVEGVGLMLDPKLELIRLAKPFMRKIRLGRMQPGRIAEELSHTGTSYLQLLRDLPDELRTILSQLRSGRMRLEFEHRGLKSLDSTLDRVSNRISFAIVLAALIVGSSLIVLSDIPPHWHSIPVIGLLGFLFAGVMGFWLLLSIIRHGRM